MVWTCKNRRGKKPKQIMGVRTEARRARGGPRKGYMDKIEDIARKSGKGVERWTGWLEIGKTGGSG